MFFIVCKAKQKLINQKPPRFKESEMVGHTTCMRVDNLNERDHFLDLSVDGAIMLNCIISIICELVNVIHIA